MFWPKLSNDLKFYAIMSVLKRHYALLCVGFIIADMITIITFSLSDAPFESFEYYFMTVCMVLFTSGMCCSLFPMMDS